MVVVLLVSNNKKCLVTKMLHIGIDAMLPWMSESREDCLGADCCEYHKRKKGVLPGTPFFELLSLFSIFTPSE